MEYSIKRIISMNNSHLDSLEKTLGEIILSGYTITDGDCDSDGWPTYLELTSHSKDRSVIRKYEVYTEKDRIVYSEYRRLEDYSIKLMHRCVYDFRWNNIIRFAV